MSVLLVVLPLSLLISTAFVVAFMRSARRGEFDDLETPAHRMLLDESSLPPIQGSGPRAKGQVKYGVAQSDNT